MPLNPSLQQDHLWAILTPKLLPRFFVVSFGVYFEGHFGVLFFSRSWERLDNALWLRFWDIRVFLTYFWVPFLHPSKKHVKYKENGLLEALPGTPCRLMMLPPSDLSVIGCDPEAPRASIRVLFKQLLRCFWSHFFDVFRHLLKAI